MVGLVAIDDKRQVALEDYSTKETRFLREGETAFGYRVKSITPRGAVLEGAGNEFELRVGQYTAPMGSPIPRHLASLSDDNSGSPIPDLARMASPDRQHWFEQWRDALPTLTPEERQAARNQMRDYWRQQWEGPWEDVLSRMTPEEQQSIRREISSGH